MPSPHCPANTEEEKKILESEEVISIDDSHILDMAQTLDTSIDQVDHNSYVQNDFPLNTSNAESKHCIEILENSLDVNTIFEITEGDIEYSLIEKTEIDLEQECSLIGGIITSSIDTIKSNFTANKREVTDHLRKTKSYDIETYASQIRNESDGDSDIAEYYTSAEMEMYQGKDTEFKRECEEIVAIKMEEDMSADKSNPLISLAKRQCSNCGYKCWTNAQFRKHKCILNSPSAETNERIEVSDECAVVPSCQQVVDNCVSKVLSPRLRPQCSRMVKGTFMAETNERKEANDECAVVPSCQLVGDNCGSKVSSPRLRPQCSRAAKGIYMTKRLNKSSKSSEGIKVKQSNNKTKSDNSKSAKAEGASKSKKKVNIMKVAKTSFELKSSHASSYLRCNKCDFITKRAGVLTRHEASHNTPTIYNCEWCKFSCATREEFNIHSTDHETFKSFTCSDCLYTVRYIWMLHQHRLTHHADSYTCKFCNSKFKTASDLTKHSQSHTCSTFCCEYCTFTTPSAEGLRRHARTRHSDVTDQESKRYNCKLCTYSSHHASGLYGHLISHKGTRPYRCSVCDYTSSQSFLLKRHMLIHTQERPFKCNACDYASNTKYNLKLHKLVHTREKPHVCLTCDFATSRRNSLKVHMMTHTKEKNYSCNLCNFTCAHYSSMRRHRPTHMRTKLHCCPDCTYFCKLLSSYLRHRATVHGVLGGYSCTLCPFVCDRARQLARHRLDRHGEGGPCVTGDYDKSVKNVPMRVDPVNVRYHEMKKMATSEQMCTSNKTGAAMKKMTGEMMDGNVTMRIDSHWQKRLTGGCTKKRNGTNKKMCTSNKTGASTGKMMDRASDGMPMTFDKGSLLNLKVVCRRLTISEIIQGRLNV